MSDTLATMRGPAGSHVVHALTWVAILCAMLACSGPKKPAAVGRGAKGGVTDDGGIPVTPEDPVFGAADAYVTWVVFSDLRTASSRQLSADLDRLREAYPPDVLRVVWKHQPSPTLAQAKLASTIGQGVFALRGVEAFRRYRDLAFAERESVTPAMIRQWALSTGVAGDALDAGLERGAWADKVQRDVALALRLGATDPPASFVNGIELKGAPQLDVLRHLVDIELAKARILGQSGIPRDIIYGEAVAANRADPGSRQGNNELEDPKIVWRVPVGSSPVRGKATAPVTIVEFSDFECAACKRAAATIERVRVSYGDSVRVVWKDAPPPAGGRVSPGSYLARAARAQKGDDGFWDMYDRLLALAKLDELDLEMAAGAASLDAKTAMAAVHSQAYRKEVDADLELADDVEVAAPPQTFVNGKRYAGELSDEKLRAIVEENVRKADALVHSGIEPSALYEWFIKDGLPGEPVNHAVPIPPNAPFRGPASAQIVVQEFSDAPCDACARAEPVLDDILKAFPGVVKVVWRDLPMSTHDGAVLAAEAAREAFAEKGNDGFWKARTILQSQIRLPRDQLYASAGELDLDAEKFRTALDAHTRKPLVDADAQAAADAGILSTPTFVVGSYIFRGKPSFARLSRLVRKAIAEAPAPKGHGPARSSPTRFSIVDLVVGTGPQAQPGNEVSINYSGRLLDGKVFDSTSRRGPFTFTLGAGNVIQAWDRGIVGMRVGGRRRLTVPPELAYGNHGLGTSIPPNSVVVFEVELVSVK